MATGFTALLLARIVTGNVSEGQNRLRSGAGGAATVQQPV